MSEPISFDLDVNNDKALLAFDESIRGMVATKAASEQLIAAMGGIEKVAEGAGVSTAKAAKLAEQSVKQAAKEVEKAQQEAAAAAEKAAKEAAAAAVRAAKEAEQAQIRAAKEAAKELERFEKLAAKAYREQQKEAAKAAKAIEKSQRQTAQEAEKAARTVGNSWGQVAKRMQSNQLISDLEQIGSMGIIAGGSISKLSMIFTSAVRPVAMLATILGPSAPLVMGLLAIPAGALAAAMALKGLANAAAESRKELEEMGQRVTNKQAQQLNEYSESTERLQVAFDKLWVAIGAPIATKLADIAETAAWAAEKMQPLTDGLALYIEQQNPLQDALGESLRAEKLQGEAIAEHAKRISMLAGVRAKTAAENKKLDEEERKLRTKFLDEEIEQAKKREKEAAQKAKQRREEEKRTQEQLDDMFRDSVSDLLTEEGKILAARDERIRQLQALKVSEQDAADLTVALEEQAQRQIQQLYAERWAENAKKRKEALKDERADAEAFQRDIGRMLADRAREDAAAQKEALESSLTEMADAWLSFVQDIAELRMEALQEDLDALKKRTENAREQLGEQWEDFRKATQGMTDEQRKGFRERSKADRDATRDRIELLQAEKAETRKAIREAFAVSQAAATAQVIMQGALAWTSMMAGLALAMGPLAPLAPAIATGIVVPAVGAQLATIASQKPPAHSGGVFGADEFFIGDQMVRQGEKGAVLNQRAVEQGGEQKVNAMNEGKGGASSSVIQVVMADSGRAVGSAWMAEAKRPGSPLARAVGSAPRGFSDVYRRRGR